MTTTPLRTRSALVLTCAAAALAFTPGAGAQKAPVDAKADWQLRAYDVGDLPAHNGDASAPPVETGAYIAEQLGLPSFPLGPGLLAVQAEADQHDTLAGAFESLRSTYTDRVALRIAIHRAGAREGAPDALVGARYEGHPGAAMAEHQQVVRRRLPTALHMSATHNLITDTNPIVGQSAVAFDPTVESLSEGLEIRAHVGAAHDGRSIVRIAGALTSLTTRDIPAGPAGPSAELLLQLPTIQRRSVDSAVAVEPGAETIFAVVQSPYDQAERLVLTVRISPVEP